MTHFGLGAVSPKGATGCSPGSRAPLGATTPGWQPKNIQSPEGATAAAPGASPEALPLPQGLRPSPVRRPCGAREIFLCSHTPGWRPGLHAAAPAGLILSRLFSCRALMTFLASELLRPD